MSGGPFLWTKHAHALVVGVHTPDSGPSSWSAAHDGYAPAVHRRTVELDGTMLRIVDEVLGDPGRSGRLAFHLGPDITVALDGGTAQLSWDGGAAVLDLPPELSWTSHRGEMSPPLGWYSAGFGRKVPSTTLVGTGTPGRLDHLVALLSLGPR